jgi:hypothetical protein
MVFTFSADMMDAKVKLMQALMSAKALALDKRTMARVWLNCSGRAVSTSVVIRARGV